MTDVHVFATILPLAPHYDDVLATLQSIVPATRQESGCKRFELNTGADGDGALYLVEIWDHEAALLAHHQAPYTVQAAQRIAGKLAAQTQVIKMTPAA